MGHAAAGQDQLITLGLTLRYHHLLLPAWNPLIRLDWLASELQESFCLCLSTAGLQVCTAMHSFLRWVLGPTLRFPCLQSKCLPDQAHHVARIISLFLASWFAMYAPFELGLIAVRGVGYRVLCHVCRCGETGLPLALCDQTCSSGNPLPYFTSYQTLLTRKRTFL